MIVVAGCEVEAVGPSVGITPGYYYDEEYVDVGGYHHHPATTGTTTAHDWSHRDAVPHGYDAHDRAALGYVHGAAPHSGGGGGDHGGRWSRWTFEAAFQVGI